MRLFVTQQMFEPIVCKKVAEEDGDLRFPSELIGFQQDVDGVTALVRNTETGGKTVIRSRYLIAADGNRSMVREKLGIGFESHGLLSHSITIYFDMDVGKYVKGSYNGVIYVNNDTVRSLFRIDKSGPEGFFVINTSGERGTERSRYPDDILTDEGAQEMLRAAVGNDNEFKITLISPWRAVCDNAERYPQGRVLLVGDAAATVTPNGGFSADSHNRRAGECHFIPWLYCTPHRSQCPRPCGQHPGCRSFRSLSRSPHGFQGSRVGLGCYSPQIGDYVARNSSVQRFQ